MHGTAGSESHSCYTLRLASQLGRACVLSQEYGIPTEHEGYQIGYRQSDNLIVLKKSGNADGGKGVT